MTKVTSPPAVLEELEEWFPGSYSGIFLFTGPPFVLPSLVQKGSSVVYIWSIKCSPMFWPVFNSVTYFIGSLSRSWTASWSVNCCEGKLKMHRRMGQILVQSRGFVKLQLFCGLYFKCLFSMQLKQKELIQLMGPHHTWITVCLLHPTWLSFPPVAISLFNLCRASNWLSLPLCLPLAMVWFPTEKVLSPDWMPPYHTMRAGLLPYYHIYFRSHSVPTISTKSPSEMTFEMLSVLKAREKHGLI